MSHLEIGETLCVNVGEPPGDVLDRSLDGLVGQKGRLALVVGARLLDVVDPGEHAHTAVLQDGKLLRELLLRDHQRARHGDQEAATVRGNQSVRNVTISGRSFVVIHWIELPDL